MEKLVFDVGGTNVKYALMENDATIKEHFEIPTVLDSFEGFMDSLMPIYQKYQDQIDGIAFSLPGRINSETGFVYSPGALVFNYKTNFVERASHYFPCRITIENDGKCAALAEKWKGNLQDVESGIVMVIGTGIGGGIILDNKLYKGHDFFAGEFSYMMTQFNNCSLLSSLAYSASTSALIRMVAADKKLEATELDGKKIFALIEKGDEDAIKAFDQMCTILAGGIFTIQAIINPEKVLLGGGISKQPLVVKTVNDKVNEIYEKIQFEIPHAKIGTCKFFNESNLIGALYAHQQNC